MSKTIPVLLSFLGVAAFGCRTQADTTDAPTPTPRDAAVKPRQRVHSTPSMSPADQQEQRFRPLARAAPGVPSPARDNSQPPVIETPEIIVVAKKRNGPWPHVPDNCVYTGIVLEHDTTLQPHSIVLENMCYRESGNSVRVYAGYHVPVEVDENGRYELPFHKAHLEEDGQTLYFVFKMRDEVVREVLEPGPFAPGTMTFGPKLDRYEVLSIRPRE